MRLVAALLFHVPESGPSGNEAGSSTGTNANAANAATASSAVNSLLTTLSSFRSSSTSAPDDGSSKPNSTGPFLVGSAFDVAHLSFFERSAAKEFILFACRTVAKASTRGVRQSVREGNYLVHCFNRRGLCACVCADDAYPRAGAFALVTKLLDEYTALEGAAWQSTWQDSKKSLPWMDTSLAEAQDPRNVDKLAKIQSQIDETKSIAETTIRGMLNRGEKLEDLVAASDDLSMASKMFLKNGKDMNKCCKLL